MTLKMVEFGPTICKKWGKIVVFDIQVLFQSMSGMENQTFYGRYKYAFTFTELYRKVRKLTEGQNCFARSKLKIYDWNSSFLLLAHLERVQTKTWIFLRPILNGK